MNLYECQDFFKNMYPNKKIEFKFDQKCHRLYEIVMTDGVPNPMHHVENNKVRVDVEGIDPIYVSIVPHRECYTHELMMETIQKINN